MQYKIDGTGIERNIDRYLDRLSRKFERKNLEFKLVERISDFEAIIETEVDESLLPKGIIEVNLIEED